MSMQDTIWREQQGWERDDDEAAPFTLGPWETHYGHDLTGYPCYFIHGVSGDEKRNGARLEANARLIATAPELYVRLSDLIAIIDKAGLLNLSNGVQLGQTSWYVKASERLELARQAVAKAVTGGNQPAQGHAKSTSASEA